MEQSKKEPPIQSYKEYLARKAREYYRKRLERDPLYRQRLTYQKRERERMKRENGEPRPRGRPVKGVEGNSELPPPNPIGRPRLYK